MIKTEIDATKTRCKNRCLKGNFSYLQIHGNISFIRFPNYKNSLTFAKQSN